MDNKYSLNDTTKKERAKLIDEALAISTLDCKAPLEEDMQLFQKYIDGEMVIDELQQAKIKKYSC